MTSQIIGLNSYLSRGRKQICPLCLLRGSAFKTDHIMQTMKVQAFVFELRLDIFKRYLSDSYTKKNDLLWCWYIPWNCHMDHRYKVSHRIYHRNLEDMFCCNLYHASWANILSYRKYRYFTGIHKLLLWKLRKLNNCRKY